MAHYDIYDDLGIDRSLDSARIVNLIDERLASTPHDNSAEHDRLSTSRRLFEDDARRAAYDKALDDPNQPDITISKFRAFADHAPQKQNPWANTEDHYTASPQSANAIPPKSTNAISYPHDNRTGLTPEHSAQLNLNLAAIAVPADRKRTQSLMWLIGWGLILLPWLYFLLTFLFGEHDSDGFLESLEHTETLITILVFTILHTAAMLVVLNFLWHLRGYLGRKLK
ncbi:hypothetical protein [Corynebacterium resistens]|uniref:hypothetical protein n=1 Tax=Corynebacterium resistens TaxID=258224 RepID=UPI0023572CAC|nr:hypothetical protein [Corynebacterium resistens]